MACVAQIEEVKEGKVNPKWGKSQGLLVLRHGLLKHSRLDGCISGASCFIGARSEERIRCATFQGYQGT
jgi:hypothetical protein